MTDNTQTVQGIVDSNCYKLLNEMKQAHPNSDVGVSVALYYPGNTDVPGFFKYGLAGPGIEITNETVYAIGSVTKLFTATLAAYLNVQNIIGELDQTLVGQYLGNANCRSSGVSGSYWDKVTFAQFATQTSGMPDEANGPYSDQLFADEPPSCHQLSWWNANETSFQNYQGYWIYSNAGFVTLGFAVAAAAAAGGLTGGYTALLERIITSQIGMPNTFAADDVPPNAVLAQGYNANSKRVPITDAADLKSSAQDMLAWLDAVYQAMKLQAAGDSLTPLQQALANTTNIWIANPENPDKKPTNFAMGLGWQIPTISSSQVLTKDGVTGKGGCSCWVGLTRYDSTVPPVGIALMTNQTGVDPDPTAHNILQNIIALG
jgi:CubicO group peptidase (beta-lactamase class C family)